MKTFKINLVISLYISLACLLFPASPSQMVLNTPRKAQDWTVLYPLRSIPSAHLREWPLQVPSAVPEENLGFRGPTFSTGKVHGRDLSALEPAK